MTFHISSHLSPLRPLSAFPQIAIALLGLVAATNALELTPDNWDDKTAGKTVFIKFLAPW